MGRVRVCYVGEIKGLAGGSPQEYELPTPIEVKALLGELKARHGRAFGTELEARITPEGPMYYQILVNGQNIWSREGLSTIVEDGDEVLISIPLSGG